MLDDNTLSNLDAARKDIADKELILNTGIDIQALLRLLVDKKIITVDEVKDYRKEVKESPKYAKAYMYITQTLEEIEYYSKNPEAVLREMLRRKMNSKK